MGDLIARDMLANRYRGVLDNHPLRGLVTLGTPNWGYPYLESDEIKQCKYLAQNMRGYWNPQTNDPASAVLSPFLSSLRDSWGPASYGRYWPAAAGTTAPTRFDLIFSTLRLCLKLDAYTLRRIVPVNMLRQIMTALSVGTAPSIRKIHRIRLAALRACRLRVQTTCIRRPGWALDRY